MDEEEVENKTQTIVNRLVEEPKDISSLIIDLLLKLADCTNSYQRLCLLRQITSICATALPASENALKTEIEKELNDSACFLTSRQFEINKDSTYYAISGKGLNNTIKVRPEEADMGREEATNQQAESLIPKFDLLYSRAIKAVVDCGLIEKKKPDIEVTILNKMIKELGET